MAKKISRGTKRILSLIFHLVVLFGMVSLYDSARAMLKGGEPEKATSEKTTKDEKEPPKKVKGTSMEDLMAEKQRKAKEKAEKAAQEATEKKSD